MRILEAEAQLIRDLTEEMEVVARYMGPALQVMAGRHPTLGRVVVIREQEGTTGLIVEAE